ncbi:MAG: UDP-N-acetylglucosamine 2-epimerase (non-hydrolyzing) [Planctomycetota bacterium]
MAKNPLQSITLVAGARPNFMKIAPLVHALKAHNARARLPIEYRLVHTGQHYDHCMSRSFFDELGIPEPDYNLGVQGGSHAGQTAGILVAFERLLWEHPTRLVVVVGDVNSTLACAITAKKLDTGVAHVEAGLRSFDMRMPEEINRIVTDRLSDLLFTTDPAAEENLRREGVPSERIHPVGNVMIDTLLRERERARGVARFQAVKAGGPYALLTLHRPSNVDDAPTFRRLAAVLAKLAAEIPILFPCHPRTRERMAAFGIAFPGAVTLLEPLSYLEMLNLLLDARLVLTDSGGLQEETTALGIPCITLRENTERPVTVTHGTNTVAGTDAARIRAAFRAALEGKIRTGRVPPLWDGHAAERIVAVLSAWLEKAPVP